METSKLRKFATEARVNLMEGVKRKLRLLGFNESGNAISSIVKVKEQSDLFSFLDGDPNALFGNPVHGLDDFELICFLIIR